MSTEKKIKLINPQRKSLTPEKLRELSGLNLSDEQAEEVIWSLTQYARIVYDFNFLRNYVLFEKPETNRKSDKLFKETDKTSVMNTVEYLKMEGKEEAAAAFVENLLKGSDFVVEKIASLANVSVEFVNKVKNQLNGTR